MADFKEQQLEHAVSPSRQENTMCIQLLPVDVWHKGRGLAKQGGLSHLCFPLVIHLGSHWHGDFHSSHSPEFPLLLGKSSSGTAHSTFTPVLRGLGTQDRPQWQQTCANIPHFFPIDLVRDKDVMTEATKMGGRNPFSAVRSSLSTSPQVTS